MTWGIKSDLVIWIYFREFRLIYDAAGAGSILYLWHITTIRGVFYAVPM